MNSPTKIDPPSNRSMSKINNIHSMSWLKQDCSPQKRAEGKDGKIGKIMSVKKTNEDYFPGTREEKKGKKKKEKKRKPVLTMDDLKDLVNRTQQIEKPLVDLKDNPVGTQEEAVISHNVISSESNTNTAKGNAWSTTTSAAAKLFPNVQSVKIDRLAEEEIMTRAIAKSIATIQLEQFKRPTPEEENRWEALYGDTDEEGGWDNVKRNLPSALETTSSGDDTSGQRKSCDDNNNSSKSGISRNKKKQFIEPKDEDFCFKKLSESSNDESKTSQPPKSVSFNDSIAVKIHSNELSKNNESCKVLNSDKTLGPNIDKFGRVGGYSERRLFMGKGARMREQEYIQNKCSLGIGDIRHQNLEPNSQASQMIKTRKPAVTTSQYPKNSQSRKCIPDLKNPKIEKATIVKNSYRIPKILEEFEHNVEKLDNSVIKSSSGSTSLSLDSTEDSTNNNSIESSVRRVSPVKLKPKKSEMAELKPIERRAATLRGTGNTKILNNIASNTLNDRRTKERPVNHWENELVSSSTETIEFSNKKSKNEPKVTSSWVEINNPLQSREIIEIKDLQENIQNQNIIPEKLASVPRIVDNVSEVQVAEDISKSVGRCLVPTFVTDDGYSPNISTTNFQYTNSIAATSSAEFQRAAYQNLLLAGVSHSDLERDYQNLITCNLDSQNLHSQNYSIHDSVPCDTLPLRSETLNNVQHIQPKCIRNRNRIHPNIPTNQNYNSHSIPPNYINGVDQPPMDHTEHAYFMHHLDAQNSPYHTLSVNSDHFNVSNNCREQSSAAQLVPGMRKLQLPPGFTRKESIQRLDTDTNNLETNSPAVIQNVKDAATEKAKFYRQVSVPQNTNNYQARTSEHLIRHEKSPTQSTDQNSRSSLEMEKNYYELQTDSQRQETVSAQNQKEPDPILGPTQDPHESSSNFQSDQVISYQSTKSHSKDVNDQSLSENSLESRSYNNNYVPSSTSDTNSDLDCEGNNDSSQNCNIISQSAVPVICRIPDQQSLGSNNVPNWQYNVDLMNPTQVPMNFVPNCQMAMQNPYILPVIVPPNYFKPPIYQNAGFQRLPMHMFTPVQMPACPHVVNIDGDNIQNVRPINMLPPKIHSVIHHVPSVKMAYTGILRSAVQQSDAIVGAHSRANYNLNLNQIPMGQVMSNSNFYATATVPNIQNSFNVRNNQTEGTMGQVCDNLNMGRGRGRLSKTNLP